MTLIHNINKRANTFPNNQQTFYNQLTLFNSNNSANCF